MLFRWLLGYPVSLLIMPSQSLLAKDDPDLAKLRESQEINGVPFSNHSIDSTKKARINFCEAAKHPSSLVKNQKIIIHAVGNADCYENHMHEYALLAQEFPHARIVGFNFRGTMNSTGRAWSENDWIEDVKSIVKHYQDQGVPLENILLNGQSLGAAIVTLAAAKIYQEAKDKAIANKIDPKTVKSLKLLNTRSFSSVTEFVLFTILGNMGSALFAGLIYGSIIGLLFGASLPTCALLTATSLMTVSFITNKISFGLMRPLINSLFWLAFGTIDAYSAFKSLPEDCVDHIVAKNDMVIKKEVGLHYALVPFNKIKKAESRKIILENHDAKKKAQALNELLNLKDSKVALSNKPFDGFRAHNESLICFNTYHKARGHSGNLQITGEEVMVRKINRLFK